MRGLFRRKKGTGKHALGAAVTGIPSAPLRAALPPLPVVGGLSAGGFVPWRPTDTLPSVVAAPTLWSAPLLDRAAPAEPVPASAEAPSYGQDRTADDVAGVVAFAPPIEADLLSEIAALLASGEAWSSEPPAGVVHPPASAAVPPDEQGAPLADLPTALPLADLPAALPLADLPTALPVQVLPDAVGTSARPAVASSVGLSEGPAAAGETLAPWTFAVLGVMPSPPEPAPPPSPASPASPPSPAPPPSPASPREPALVPPAQPAPVAPLVVPVVPAQVRLPAPVPSGRSALEAALAELLPREPDIGAAIAPEPARVQLGFRDGTSTTLDPASTQSLALQELARLLTRRD